MKDNKHLFETEKISTAVWKLAIPTITAMLVVIVYNLADTFFIGQTNDTFQVSAVSLATPIFMFLMAVGNLFGMGASATISRNLGEGRNDRTKNVSSFAFYGGLAIGIISGLALFFFAEDLAKLLGADEFTIGFVTEYVTYLSIGAPFIIVATSFGNIMRSEGNAKGAMFGMMIGTIVNIVLDPIFISVFDFGVAGAAIATVLGNVCSFIYYLVVLSKKNTALSNKITDFKIGDGVLKDVLTIGLPSSISGILMSISNIIYNFYLTDYGNDAVAAMGIATKGTFMIIMVIMGFAMGAQPLLGYAFGAKNFDRLKALLKYTLTTTVIMGLVIMSVMIAIAPSFVAGFLDNNPNVIEIGTMMLRALMSTGFLLGLVFVPMSVLQTMGKPIKSLILSISRQAIFIPTVIISSSLFGLNGLIWSQPIADTIAAILGVTLLISQLNKFIKENEQQENKTA